MKMTRDDTYQLGTWEWEPHWTTITKGRRVPLVLFSNCTGHTTLESFYREVTRQEIERYSRKSALWQPYYFIRQPKDYSHKGDKI